MPCGRGRLDTDFHVQSAVAQAVLVCMRHTEGCVQDIYQRLTFKTVEFWEVVSSLYNVDYVVKVDDDSYVRLDRLSIALSQWASMGSGALNSLKSD